MTGTFWRACAGLWVVIWTTHLAGAEPVDYARDIKPILSKRCYACHGVLQQKAELRLDTGTLLRKGSSSGSVVEVGKPEESTLIERITATDLTLRMPPDGTALEPAQVEAIKAWIKAGAVSPPDEKPQKDPRDHWAFRAPVRSALPTAGTGWIRNPIDAYLAEAYGKHGVTPRPEADKATLLRRAAIDLTGLPPTRDELIAFLQDTSPDAYEKMVDRYLESERHGERWARHWMDVWRYSDWYGRRAVPDVWNSAPQIWRWRDWIVKSLNTDKGYDQMVREMLAADEISPTDDEASVATGYLIRNWYALNPNQWMRDTVEHTGKAFLGLTLNCAHCHDHKYDPITQEDYFRFRAFFEPINVRQDRVPGEADPGPFQVYDYAVLRKIQPLGLVRIYDERPDAPTLMYQMGDERILFNRPPATAAAPAFFGASLKIAPVELPVTAWYPGIKPFVTDDEVRRTTAAVALAETQLAAVQPTVAAPVELASKAEAARAAARDKFNLFALQLDAAPAEWTAQLDLLLVAETEAAKAKRLADEARSVLRWQTAQLVNARAQRDAVQARMAADRTKYLGAPGDADVLAKVAGRAERQAALYAAEEQIFSADSQLTAANAKGEAAAQKAAEKLKTAAVAALAAAQKASALDSPTYTPFSPVYPKQTTGRRRALAEWMTRRDHPLTARVAVNHVWMRHFGRPLVPTVSDFGLNGKPPTHPELLDWLAVELVESNWSLKKLHRLIVTSAAYRMQSSAGGTTVASQQADPDNKWMWRFPLRRAEAEVVRDSVLYVAGQLDLTVGGAPIENDKELVSRRRSLYFSTYPEDGGHPKFLEMFDAPDPCDCYRRSESLVPQQALAMTNSPLVLTYGKTLSESLSSSVDTALAAAVGVGTANADPNQRASAFVTRAYETILTRQPTADELKVCVDYLNSGDASARESLVRALLNHDDFVTIR